jgi:hypothetical protein
MEPTILSSILSSLITLHMHSRSESEFTGTHPSAFIDAWAAGLPKIFCPNTQVCTSKTTNIN